MIFKWLCILICWWQKIEALFSDDEPYDPSWMDRNKWEYSRL